MKPMSAVVSDFDQIADALAKESSRELSAAERFLLRQVPVGATSALDVGCGDGVLSRALAARGITTLGIDASPQMIALAKSTAGDFPRLSFQVADIVAGPPPGLFDVVISVAMVHHVPLHLAVQYLRSAIAPGGTLLIQDVTNRTGFRHLPVNGLAWLVRRVRSHFTRSRDARVHSLYTAHGVGESYLDQSHVAESYRNLLPGATIHHHLEWRYTVVWKRDE